MEKQLVKMKMKRIATTAFLLTVAYGSYVIAQLDPLPGDPLPGDPGIEVPLDLPIALAILGVGGLFFVLFMKKRKK